MATDTEKGLENTAPPTTIVSTQSSPNTDYDSKSFMNRVAETRQNSKSGIALCFGLCGIVIGSVGFTIIMTIFSVVPICMVYLGGMHLKHCTIEKFIPIYLLVGGSCTLLDQILHCFKCRKKEIIDSEGRKYKRTLIGWIFDAFTTIWLLVGSIFVLKIYEPNYNPAMGPYCHKTTYLFAFWICAIAYGACIFALILIGCVSLIMYVLFSRDDREEEDY